jgi:hypothetical protein
MSDYLSTTSSSSQGHYQPARLKTDVAIKKNPYNPYEDYIHPTITKTNPATGLSVETVYGTHHPSLYEVSSTTTKTYHHPQNAGSSTIHTTKTFVGTHSNDRLAISTRTPDGKTKRVWTEALPPKRNIPAPSPSSTTGVKSLQEMMTDALVQTHPADIQDFPACLLTLPKTIQQSILKKLDKAVAADNPEFAAQLFNANLNANRALKHAKNALAKLKPHL